MLDVEFLGRKKFPALVWPQIVCPQHVVEECAGSGVGAQLLDPGLSELCHPGDCLMGLQNHAGKSKQYGKFVHRVSGTYVLWQRQWSGQYPIYQASTPC